MKRTAAVLSLVLLTVFSSGCFLFSPRLNLERLGTIGFIGFDSRTRGNISDYAGQVFLEVLLRSQPRARIKELGPSNMVLGEYGSYRLTPEALDALGLEEVRRIEPEDGSFILVFLGDGQTAHRLELTWLRDRTEKYNLGDNEIHLAFRTDDYDEAYQRHKKMGVVCYENPKMGIYFIEEPDGYWIEILPPVRA